MNNTHAEQPVKVKEFDLLTLDPGVSIWAVLTFAILLILLKRFAWKPIIDSLDEREKRLQSSLKTAEDARNESCKIAEQQKEILLQSRQEASEIMNIAKASAEDFKQKIEISAKNEKEKILASAETEINSMKDAAVRELKNTAVNLAIGAAEKLLDENLNESKSKILIEKYINNMEQDA